MQLKQKNKQTELVTVLNYRKQNSRNHAADYTMVLNAYEVPKIQGVHCMKSVFTARCYASAVLAMGLCPSVCHKSEFY